MATQPTNIPVPSESPRDLKFNAGKIDEFVTSMARQYIDRFGNTHYTIEGMRWIAQQAIAAFGYITMDSFQAGATLTLPNQVLRDTSTGEYYRWDGAFPKAVPVGSTPDSTGGVGVGAWLSVGDATLRTQLSKLFGADRFNILLAKMASGSTVKIACYGDSTTDGNGTTGWTPNPVDSDGNAVGNSDHNLTAPNAWPNQLQTLLRDMYSNSNIYVYNAGYSGQRMDNGWAYSNYDNAITDNPYYGVCDAVFIDFGLNDITDGYGVLDDHISQTEMLINKILYQGSIPVLLTSGPEYRDNDDGGAGRDNEQISQQINAAKQSIADKYQIKLIDKALAIKNYMNKNLDGVQWATVQPDGLHFGNQGHTIQCNYIASKLYGDIINITDGGVENISFLDSRSNSPAGNAQIYRPLGYRFGANPLYENAFIANNLSRPVIRMWVYCETATAGVAYMAIDADYQNTYDPSKNSKIRVTPKIDNNPIYDGPTVNTGYVTISGGIRFGEVPILVSSLSYGLNLVEYVFPSDTSVLEASKLYHGWFKIADKMAMLQKNGVRYNLLSESGQIFYSPATPDGGNRLIVEHKKENLSNCISFRQSGGVAILIECDLSVGCGISLMGDSVGVSTSSPYIDQVGLMLYRLNTTTVGLYTYYRTNDGTIGFNPQLASGTLASGLQNVRVNLSIDGTTKAKIIGIQSGWGSGSNVLTYTEAKGTMQNTPCGGAFGSVYVNTSVATAGAYAHVKSASLYLY